MTPANVSEVGGYRLVAEHNIWTEICPADQALRGDTVVSSNLVCPALIDLHVHVGRGSSPFSVPPEVLADTGVRVGCSQGDAGCDNLTAWLKSSVDSSSRVKSVIALNVAPLGEVGGSSGLEGVNSKTSSRVIALSREQPETVRMISVNLSRRALGRANARDILSVALRCRDESGLPLMIGLAEEGELPLSAQLDLLVAGDIITYCYRSQPWCLFPRSGNTDSIERAVERGVRLDVGHGVSSFNHHVARRAIGRGFRPYTISSDLQMRTAFGYKSLHLLDVAKKLVECGLEFADALAAMTHRPAKVLGLADGTGSIRVGGQADLTVLKWTPTSVSARQITL